MVQFWSHSFTYNHPWTMVTQAIWQKYPNPFASHVLAADVIDRTVDPVTGVITTTRLFLKKGKTPSWGRSILPKSEAYILETSTLDPLTRTFTTTTKNLSHTKLMLVVETQTIQPHPEDVEGRTEIKTSAEIVSNTGWVPIRQRIEGFGLKRLKDNTFKSSRGLLHVLERLKAKAAGGPMPL
ncbi:hypothetical protein HDV05_005859 [Chytridiales sp. JEL 0842]|nr:hypothetical protein HDV05_005859 [Chytridiales sp. JEL 0842]